MLASNTNHRQIERVTGIDRKTIRTYAKRIEKLKANSSGVAKSYRPKEAASRITGASAA